VLRQAAENQQPGDFDKVGMVRELLDRNAPIPQDAFVPVDVRDRTLAGCRVAQSRIEGDHAGLVSQLGNIDRRLAIRSHEDG